MAFDVLAALVDFCKNSSEKTCEDAGNFKNNIVESRKLGSPDNSVILLHVQQWYQNDTEQEIVSDAEIIAAAVCVSQ
ncbi:hypothetical protein TNCV_1740571 [Trichonephila clavipes]|uniref:Uncharacterized protein n=1 Tax=Trichonephila clavipes TaxID=2585209 RepID=A0A8X6RGH6_TRICX|nr:hypothetical protein TNCV_1740571 [Trichonephila clavipes]